jgi:hypothetical protein
MNTMEKSALLEQLIDTYCSAWNEPDPQRRQEIINVVWDEAGTYTDPNVYIVGRQDLVEHIGRVLARRVGARIVRTSVVDSHHDLVRFAWQVILADGTLLPEGIDFAEISSDGKIRRIMGFFGPLARL